jgi:hypothetical protein
MGTAWQAQKEQKFGKETLRQVFTTERAFQHVVFPLLKQGYLDSDDMSNLFTVMPNSRTLWNEFQRVKVIDWTHPCQHYPNWKDQTKIDDNRVDMRPQCCFITTWISQLCIEKSVGTTSAPIGTPRFFSDRSQVYLIGKIRITSVAFFARDARMSSTKKPRMNITWRCTNTETTSRLDRTSTRSC